MASMSNVQWKQHKDTLTQIFKEFRRNNVATDVEIHCKGYNLRAHRAVLAASSDFFDLILREHPPHVEPVIVVENVDLACMQAIVSYMYTGVMEIDAMMTANFLSVCSYFQIKGLMTYQILSKNDGETELAGDVVPEPVQIDPLIQDEVVETLENEPEIGESTENDLFVFLETPASSTRIESNSDRIITHEKVTRRKQVVEEVVLNEEDVEEEDEEEEDEEDELMKYSPPKKSKPSRATGPRESSGYTIGQLADCVEAVCQGGMSLSSASQAFHVPKSVLWRKLQKCVEYKSRPTQQKREDAKKALLGGESMVTVSKKFKIPLATLYRDKNKMVTDGKLNNLKPRIKSDDNSNLFEAAEACRNGMSKSEAARRFNIPKSTLWRKLKSMDSGF